MCGTPRAPGDYATASALVALAPDEVVPRNRTGTLDEEAGPASFVSLRSTFSPQGEELERRNGWFSLPLPPFLLCKFLPSVLHFTAYYARIVYYTYRFCKFENLLPKMQYFCGFSLLFPCVFYIIDSKRKPSSTEERRFGSSKAA